MQNYVISKFKPFLNSEELPKEPGIYRFLDKKEQPLYIGKAKNLNKRVKTYFQNLNRKSKKIQNLIELSCKVDITITNNELEALLLEQHLIKEHKPKFNVQFKDDKGYPWIRIDSQNEFPSAIPFRGKKDSKANYFGPFPSSYAVNNSIKLIQKTFKIRNCTNTFFSNRTRPCIQYEMHRCSAPCVKKISKKEYNKDVKSAEMLLKGMSEDLIENFYSTMDELSKNKEYEKAVQYRDKISALREIQRNQSIAGYKKERHAVCTLSVNGITKIGVTHVKNGWIVSHENFIQDNINLEESIAEAFIKKYYLGLSDCPSFIVSKDPISEKNVIEQALSSKHNKIIRIITKPNKQDKGLLKICLTNIRLGIKSSKEKNTSKKYVMDSLKGYLGITTNLGLIECFDISHHSGDGAIAGCVVYSEEGVQKDKFKLFNISKVNSGNDISSMKEAVTRRFKNEAFNQEIPDLLIIDGGKAHLKAVKDQLEELSLKKINVISISKGIRRKAEFDSIHKTDGTTIAAQKGITSNLFLQEIRDEAHRFTLSIQKRKIRKSSLESNLDGIMGVGTKKKKLLLRFFGSAEQIERANVDDLMRVEGIGPKIAEAIINHLK